MIVIVAILLQQLGVVSKNDGRAVSRVARSLTAININVRILATRVIVYLAIRQVSSFVNAVVNKRHVTAQVRRGNVKKNVEWIVNLLAILFWTVMTPYLWKILVKCPNKSQNFRHLEEISLLS